MMNTTTARIYADPDTYQDVRIEYVGEKTIDRRLDVEYVKVLSDLEVEPSDLQMDLEEAIAEEEKRVVRIWCKIEVNKAETV